MRASKKHVTPMRIRFLLEADNWIALEQSMQYYHIMVSVIEQTQFHPSQPSIIGVTFLNSSENNRKAYL